MLLIKRYLYPNINIKSIIKYQDHTEEDEGVHIQDHQDMVMEAHPDTAMEDHLQDMVMVMDMEGQTVQKEEIKDVVDALFSRFF